MDWTAGYASDVEYTTGFYREQSPAWLNLVCVLNGLEPVPLDRPFTYCELGFGRGLTSQMLAAGNPAGRFYASDFNPAHVAGARQLAEQAGLGNLILLEHSFEELANGAAELPQFDFISLHGIYTWVTAENRQHIVRFISRYLKPGGLIYVSYNAMPGWAQALPLQRLLVEHAGLHTGRSDAQLKAAIDFVGQLQGVQTGYIAQNPTLASRIDVLKTADAHYLVHEYMHKHWQPLYHADVARDLNEAKMSYAGSADLPYAYPALFLNEQRGAMLEPIADPALRETLKDYFLNTAFRKDVFVRGARRMSAYRQAEWLSRISLVLTVPRAEAQLKMTLPFGEITGRADFYTAAFDALALRPHSLAELRALPAFAGHGIQTLGQLAALLCATNQATFYFDWSANTDVEPAQRLNDTLASHARYGDDYAAFCSPLLGSAVPTNYLERLFYLAVRRGPPNPSADSLAGHAWQLMAPTGRRMQRNGAALQTPEENIDELVTQAGQFMRDKLPLWRQLRVV